MYKQVQMTQEEMKLLSRVIEKYSADYPEDEKQNLYVLLRLLERNYAGDWASVNDPHKLVKN